MDFEIRSKLTKIDESLGLVFGLAMVNTIDGEDYFDLQGDNIPEEAMLKAATEFMSESREVREMHQGDRVGEVLFAFPLTRELAEAYEIQTRKTGLLIGVRPNQEVLEKFRSGEYTGFSIGGTRIDHEPVEDSLA